MAKCGLIGNPIAHSKSPALFRAAYGEGAHTYTLIEAPACNEAMRRFREEGFNGINVTSPFKDEVMEHVSFPDRISSLLGSANTIISQEGLLYSYNTDYYGVRNTLEDFLCPKGNTTGNRNVSCAEDSILSCPEANGSAETRAADFSPIMQCKESACALVIGAGGAGKAAALAVKDMGMHVFFANRSRHAAAPFAEKIGVEYIPLEKIPLVLPLVGIIVYSLSMEIEQLRGVSLEGKAVFEANYAHPNLQGNGASRYIGGRHWLYNQAIPAFRLFTGAEPDTHAMKEALGICG